jgi:hypothetical protein
MKFYVARSHEQNHIAQYVTIVGAKFQRDIVGLRTAVRQGAGYSLKEIRGVLVSNRMGSPLSRSFIALAGLRSLYRT